MFILAKAAHRANHAEVGREQPGLQFENAAKHSPGSFESARALHELCGVQEHDRLRVGLRPSLRGVRESVRRARPVATRQARRGCQNSRYEVVSLELCRVLGCLFGRRRVTEPRELNACEQLER